jgi:hypothetical protein
MSETWACAYCNEPIESAMVQTAGEPLRWIHTTRTLGDLDRDPCPYPRPPTSPELLPELVVRTLALMEQQYLEKGDDDVGLAQVEHALGIDYHQVFDAMGELRKAGLVRTRGWRALGGPSWELEPAVRRRLLDQDPDLPRKWRQTSSGLHGADYQVRFVLDYTTPVEAEEFPRQLPSIREVLKECGCRIEVLRNDWSLLHACHQAHGHKGGDFVVYDKSGVVLGWTSTIRTALRQAMEQAARPQQGQAAIRILARRPQACGCIRYDLACGWFMDQACGRAHAFVGGERWGVFEPGGDESGSAAIRGWGRTKAEALARALENLELRTQGRTDPEPDQLQLLAEAAP